MLNEGILRLICPHLERRDSDNGVVCVLSVVVGRGMNRERESVYQICIYVFCGLFSQTVGVRCAFGQTSTIIRLSFGYLSVILRSCLLIGGCKDGILLVRLSLIYGILCAKSAELFALARRIYSLKCTPYISSVRLFRFTVIIGYPTELFADYMLKGGDNNGAGGCDLLGITC